MMKTRVKSAAPVICGFLAYLIWGFCYLFTKGALGLSSPSVLLAWRFTAAFVLMNILLLSGVFKLRLRGKNIISALPLGLFEPLLYFVFEYYGLMNLSTVFSSVIIAIIPVMVLILARIFLREKPTGKQVVFCLVSIAGVVAISLMTGAEPGGNKLLGIILMVCAMLCTSLYNLFSRKCSVEFTSFESSYIMIAESFIGFWIFALIMNLGDLSAVISPLRHGSFVFSAAYLGVFPSVGSYLLLNYANSKLPLARTAIFANITTVVSVIMGIVVLHEEFSPLSILCSVVILIGIWGVQKYARSDRQ